MTGTTFKFPRSAFVGFDHIFGDIERLAAHHQKDHYPPHNIIKHSDDEYLIELAVVGFKEEDIDIRYIRDNGRRLCDVYIDTMMVLNYVPKEHPYNKRLGKEKGPEVAFQFGYAGLVGSDELSLGVRDMSLTIGKSIAFGPYFESNTSHFTPFLSVGVLQTQSIILSDNQLKDELGLENYSSINTNEQLEGITSINGPSPAFATLGMHFLSNDFRFQIVYRNTFGTLSSVAMSLGFLY